jgi:Na+-transporting NADH:ubiquinone oxidoreductase subunit NqrB
MSLSRDPRNYQIATLFALVAYGLIGLDLEIQPGVAFTIIIVALAVQLAGTRLAKLPRFDPKSAFISSLSLCLLLRTDALGLAAVTAAVTIASKFLLRIDGRHVFNPTNFGLAVMMALGTSVWVSPGQWGTGAFFAFLLVGCGGLVIHRAARSDVTYALIGFYAAIVFARAAFLGDPLAIPVHHLQNGAFLLFAFFMISDPKTTPDSRAGRIVFALMVAVGAGFVHFVLFQPNGLLWSLVLSAPATPLLNRLLPGARYQWQAPSAPAAETFPERSFA